MNLVYVADARFPTEKAHGIQIMAMCQAFSHFLPTTLVLPDRRNPLTESPFTYYQQPETFLIRKVPVCDLTHYEKWFGGWFVYGLEKRSFAWSVCRLLRNTPEVITYHRDFRTFLRAQRLGIHAAWEVHDLPSALTKKQIRACNASKGIVCITNGLKRVLVNQGVHEKRILVVPDGVDLNRFCVRENITNLRERLGLPMNKILLIYAGHFYPWKGVDTVIEAMVNLPMNIELIILGAGPRLEELKEKARMLSVACRFFGAVPHASVPEYLTASDIVVIPNSGKEQISRSFTSPLKVFEAMAVGKAIIASDLPSLREILREEWAVFASPDNPLDWANAIQELAENAERRRLLGVSVAEQAKQFDWKERARSIIDFIKTQTSET